MEKTKISKKPAKDLPAGEHDSLILQDAPPVQEAPALQEAQQQAQPAKVQAQGYFENWLVSFSAVGEQELLALRNAGLCGEEKFAHADAKTISDVSGMAVNHAFALKAYILEKVKQQEAEEVAIKLMEQQNAIGHLAEEIERITNANHVGFERNRELNQTYAELQNTYNALKEEHRVLQDSVATAQIEVNRISQEVEFLKDERQRLLDFAADKHGVLAGLLARFSSLKSSYEFVSGETEFSQDMLLHLETLLDKAVDEKRTFEKKIGDAETSIENLYGELNAIILRGKTSFYKGV